MCVSGDRAWCACVCVCVCRGVGPGVCLCVCVCQSDSGRSSNATDKKWDFSLEKTKMRSLSVGF